jgi:hypothetical protein
MRTPHPADDVFLAVLSIVLRHARLRFRFVRCPHEREDLLQEVFAYALTWSRLLWDRGRDVREFPSALARYAVQSVRNGRRLCGMRGAKDAFNPATQARCGFRCECLPPGDPPHGSILAAALADSARSEIPEQVAFPIDFPTWLATRTERDRAIIADMLLELRTTDLAARHGVSAGRVSQLRRAYHADWIAYAGAG